jgi:DNA uptake protein ComE-like DNA-binding protein
VRNLDVLLTVALTLLLAECTAQKQTPNDLRERTAEATAQLKENAKAVAEGVREGWSRDKPLDLNKATKDQLTALPGITDDRAQRILAGRPYDDPGQLVTRRILSQVEYDRIKDSVTAKP